MGGEQGHLEPGRRHDLRGSESEFLGTAPGVATDDDAGPTLAASCQPGRQTGRGPDDDRKVHAVGAAAHWPAEASSAERQWCGKSFGQFMFRECC